MNNTPLPPRRIFRGGRTLFSDIGPIYQDILLFFSREMRYDFPQRRR